MTSFDGISLLGILLDLGLISILVVDGAATGAWTHATQTDYILTPECSDGRVPVSSSSEPSLPAATPTKSSASEPRALAPSATAAGSVPPANTSARAHPQPTAAPRVSSAPSGRLRVLTDPAGADVYVGDFLVGTTTPEGLLLELPAGTVTLSVRKASYLSVERTVTVDSKNDVVLPITLRASPQP